MKNKTFLINPNFLCRNLTGIERFAFETCKRLDEILTAEDDVRIVVPENAKTVPVYKNIKIIKSKKALKSFPLWDLFEFAFWCKKLNATGINFSNTAPLGRRCGISFIHDIYAKVFPQDFCGRKENLIKLYCCFNYKNIAKHAKKVLTVSEFSKNQIQKAYKLPYNKLEVIPNGWEHFNLVSEEKPALANELSPKSFYFTLGSLQKRKNLKWIAQYAKNHPLETFAISGKAVSGFVSNDLADLQKLPNVKIESFGGLLSDYCKEKNIYVVVRGLRAVTDFEYELQMSQMNRKLSDNKLDTVYFNTSLKYSYLSSSSVKQIAQFGGDLTDFVPEFVALKLYSLYGQNK